MSDPVIATGMYLAERYWPGVDEPAARLAVERLGRLAGTSSDAAATVLVSAYVPADQTVLVLLNAASRGAVLSLGRRAALDFDRVSEAVDVGTRSPPL
jgi:hypothetical protein